MFKSVINALRTFIIPFMKPMTAAPNVGTGSI